MRQLIRYRLFVLLFLVILVRLPAIQRPVSKHHEFNTAVILINALSWQQAGGADNFVYTPLLNFQGASNRVFEKGFHIDEKGNHVYLSFGAGWYVLPWIIFNSLYIPFTPFNLRVLNILIGLITVVLFYRLVFKTTGSSNSAFAAACMFAFLPAPLWYMGIGYVTTAIMLPLVIIILMQWQKFSEGKNGINAYTLTGLLIAGIALCYFDWLAVFLLAVIALWSLLQSLKTKRYLLVVLVSLLSIAAGVLLVLWQFAAYLGWETVLHYWKARFTDRSLDSGSMSFIQMTGAALLNLATGFAPLIFCVPAFFKYRKVTGMYALKWPWWLLLVIFLYNGIFLNWTAVHQFAWMAFGLFACYITAVYLLPKMPGSKLHRLMIATVLASLAMYFIINPPGVKSFNGDRYDKQQVTAAWINSQIPPATPIFLQGESDKIIEYYARRTFTNASSVSQARQMLVDFSLPEAVLLQVQQGKLVKATWLKAK